MSRDAVEQLVIELLAQFDHVTFTAVTEEAHNNLVPIIAVSRKRQQTRSIRQQHSTSILETEPIPSGSDNTFGPQTTWLPHQLYGKPQPHHQPLQHEEHVLHEPQLRLHEPDDQQQVQKKKQ